MVKLQKSRASDTTQSPPVFQQYDAPWWGPDSFSTRLPQSSEASLGVILSPERGDLERSNFKRNSLTRLFGPSAERVIAQTTDDIRLPMNHASPFSSQPAQTSTRARAPTHTPFAQKAADRRRSVPPYPVTPSPSIDNIKVVACPHTVPADIQECLQLLGLDKPTKETPNIPPPQKRTDDHSASTTIPQPRNGQTAPPRSAAPQRPSGHPRSSAHALPPDLRRSLFLLGEGDDKGFSNDAVPPRAFKDEAFQVKRPIPPAGTQETPLHRQMRRTAYTGASQPAAPRDPVRPPSVKAGWSTLEHINTLYSIINEDSNKEALQSRVRRKKTPQEEATCSQDRPGLPQSYGNLVGLAKHIHFHLAQSSRAALVGLPKTGKTACLRDLAGAARSTHPTICTLMIDMSDRSFTFSSSSGESPPKPFTTTADVCTIIRTHQPFAAAGLLLLLDDLNDDADAASIANHLRSMCFAVITTERAEVAQAFAIPNELVFKFRASKAKHAPNDLVQGVDMSPFLPPEWRLLPGTVARMRRFAGLHSLASFASPSAMTTTFAKLAEGDDWLDDEPIKQAYLATRDMLVNGNFPEMKPHWRGSTPFMLLGICVEQAWLSVLRKIEESCRSAIVLLGVIVCSRPRVVNARLWAKVKTSIDRGAREVLQDYGLLVTAQETQEYGDLELCHAALILVARVWLVGTDALQEALAIIATLGE